MNLRMYPYLALVIVLLALSWAADHYHSKAVVWRDKAQQAEKVARQQAAILTEMNMRQKQLNELDRQHMEKLNNAESENNTLRTQLASGTHRMYVAGRCPVSGISEGTTARRVGHDTSIELAADAGQNILAVREGIIRDQQKLKYLQEYVRTECLR
ncbi:Bacteriophage lysis protein [Photorhabdus australis subsp. thailandensis]|uniref:Bacteriophage lysis protein n=2 Tax=Photorhabdus australis TaxID=286156 RepID=A0A1C0U3I3_9GAMM|nr:lysis protein [Photorhabdus australis]OCQ52478.1 Bacteriophage lysis protein [Photorhabdus australis subsp. thailandensis]